MLADLRDERAVSFVGFGRTRRDGSADRTTEISASSDGKGALSGVSGIATKRISRSSMRFIVARSRACFNNLAVGVYDEMAQSRTVLMERFLWSPAA